MVFDGDTEKLLQACLADLEQGRFRIVADTWNCLGVVGRHSRFMKFPKNQDSKLKLALEANIHHGIEIVQPGLAPHYIYCGPLEWGHFDCVAIRAFEPGMTAEALPRLSRQAMQLCFDAGIAAARVHKQVAPELRAIVPDRCSLGWYCGLRDQLRGTVESKRFHHWSDALDTIRAVSGSLGALPLIHGDLKPMHLLRLADGRVRFLDWSNVRKEHAAFDCATMKANCNDQSYEAFKEGYKSVTSYPEEVLVDAHAHVIDMEAAWFEHRADIQRA